MLNSLYLRVLNSPLRVLLVALTAGILLGAIMWRLGSVKARAAWTHSIAHPATDAPAVYRASPSTIKHLPMPLWVPATAFTSGALCAGHLGCILVAIDAVREANWLLVLTVLCFATLGTTMSLRANRLVTQSGAIDYTMHCRAVQSALLSLGVHGGVMFAFAAFAMGWLDTLSLEVYHWGFPSKGLEGRWETINLHGFLKMQSSFVSAKGLHPITWRMLGLCMLLYASGTLVAAVLTLTIAWRTVPKECPSCGQRSLRVYPRADGLDAGLPFLLLALLAGWMWRSYWWIFGALLYGALVRVGDKLCARFCGIWYWGGTRCAHCSNEVMLE